MSKVLVLYYSSYGHTEQLAHAAAAGAREAGAEAVVKRVAETVPEQVARDSHYKLDQEAPEAAPDELPGYDGIIIAMPTRYGRMPSQMAAFWDKTGGLWAGDALVGKVGAVMCSTAAQHGGQETTLLSGITNLLHMGMVIVGLPYSFKGQMGVDEVKGGTPYGATTLAHSDGHRQPSADELAGARFQGAHVARIAARLAA